MPIRKIIEIDEEKCTGCGQCVVDCAEGALQIIDGKAKVVKESFCDGLGACMGSCPEDALRIVEREADAFDEEEVERNLANQKKDPEPCQIPGGCPGSMMKMFEPESSNDGVSEPVALAKSELAQWPVQLELLPPIGPLYENKDMMLVVDCVAVSFPDLHKKLIKGNTIAMSCPKLDDTDKAVTKLSHIFQNKVTSITCAIMEVPCCGGLVHIVKQALKMSGADLKINVIKIGINGQVLDKFEVEP